MAIDVRKHISRFFSSEWRAASRFQAFAMQADKEGLPALALLFRVLGEAKDVHARRFGHLLRGKIGTTRENLSEALSLEIQDIEAYGRVAAEVKNADASSAVKKGFIQSRKTLEETKILLEEAVQGKTPPGDVTYFVCQICGHIHKHAIPEACPVCGAVPGRFKRVP